MNHRFAPAVVLLLALVSAGLSGALIGSAAPAPAPVVRLPLIAGPLTPTRVVLVESDTTFVSADRDAVTGRIFVSYIDRAHSNRLHFTELVSDTLVEAPAPGIAGLQPGPLPAFQPSDTKDADSALIAYGGWVWLFVSSREINEAGEPFKLWLVRFQVR